MPNSRELALLIWILALFLWVLAMPKTRNALGGLLHAALAHKILISVALMSIYIAGMVGCLHHWSLWGSGQTTTTVFWSISTAFVALARVNSIVGDEHYFRNAALDQLKLVTIFDFLINFFVFSLWVELLIVPLAALLGGMVAVSESKPEFRPAKTFLDAVLALVGLSLMFVAVIEAIRHIDTFASVATLKNFVLPPILTLLFLPFLYGFALFVSYESLFLRIRFFVNDDLVGFVKKQTIMAFHFRLRLLNKWSKHVNTLQLQSKEEVLVAIRLFLATQYASTNA